MKTKILGTVASTLVVTSLAFAQGAQGGMQSEGGQGRPPMPPQGGEMMNANVNVNAETNARPGFLQRIFGEFRGERREMQGNRREDESNYPQMNRQDGEREGWGQGEGNEGRGDGRMNERMMATGSMMMNASGTPWRDFKKDMQGRMGEMMPKMASITDTQIVVIAAKLGVTADSIKAKIASGTPLREIIGNKISREEMMTILPRPNMASGTMMATGSAMMHEDNGDRGERRSPQGFFNSMRMRIFGGDNNADIDVNANVDASVQTQAPEGIRGFFRRLFNF